MGMTTTPGMGGPYTPRPDLGPGVGFGVGLPDPNYDPSMDQTNTMPPVSGLPTQGMGGGKSMGGLGDLVSGALGQVGGVAQQIFPNQQQPITQGNGQLPPGFGALSPIDRSQIGNAQIGMTAPAQVGTTQSPVPSQIPPTPSIYSRVGGQPNVDTMPGMPGYQGPGYGQPAPAPTNRFIPQNAPGVRPSVVPTTNRQMTPMQQAQFGGAGQLGSARANLMAGKAPLSNAVASRAPSAVAARQVKAPVRRTK